MRILVTFAVQAEFAPWRRRFPFRRREFIGPGHKDRADAWYSCNTDDVHLDVYLTGIGWGGPKPLLSTLLQEKPDLCISSGLAGGLKSDLNIGEIVVAREVLLVNGGQKLASRPLLVNLAEKTGAKSVNTFLTNAHIVCAAKSKRTMSEFGDVVEMESFHVLKSARDLQVPALSVRAISDTVNEDLPLDFGRATNADGHISYGRLLLQLGMHPQRVPALFRFGKRSEKSAQNLADFLDKYIRVVRQRFPLWGTEAEAEVAAR